MTNAETHQLFLPIRIAAACSIALGGSMHALGLLSSVLGNQSQPWWYWTIFLIAITGYGISAVLIYKNKMPGYLFTLCSPIVGGSLIFLGFIFPQSDLLILIPGTIGHEITLIGFLTLITEPVAVILVALCIRHKIWSVA